MTSTPPPPSASSPYDRPAPDDQPTPYDQPTQPGGAAPYAAGPDGSGPAYAAPQAPGTDGFAITSLVTGLIGLALIPLIFGIVALRRIKRTGAGGKGLAIAGIVLGALETIGWTLLVVFTVVLANSDTVQNAVADAVEQLPDSAFHLTVGECFEPPADLSDVHSVQSTDCAEPHTAEVIGVQESTEAEYPGEESMHAAAQEFCQTAFADYVGVDFDSSELDMGYLYPTQASWGIGDRQIACWTQTMDGKPLEGSVKGSAQ